MNELKRDDEPMDCLIEGMAAPLPYSNLDTDQIMPKQFLRIIDKQGLDRGLLYDLRFDQNGAEQPDFILNRPAYRNAPILVTGPNFGCGSSREHAVWGLRQYGVRAIIASSFGEIFYFNAMNNGLLLVTLPPDQVAALLEQVQDPAFARLRIDVLAGRVQGAQADLQFQLAGRHRDMFAQGRDLVGTSLAQLPAIESFERGHWQRRPWLKDVASTVRQRISSLPLPE